MLKKTAKGYYVLEKLAQQKGLIHGFSTRKFGNCNPKKSRVNWKNIERFLSCLDLKRESLVLMEQAHSHKIKVVAEKDMEKTVHGVDGLVTQGKGVALGVKTADCLPILFYDPARKIIGVAHAGWRGILKRLPQKTIELMIRLGSLPESILVGIGPHIKGCCYKVRSQRTERFEKEFSSLPGMVIRKKNKVYLDLAVPAVTQLHHTGILQENLGLADFCTACQNKEFFSFRKDGRKSIGRMVGVIALRREV